jgi:hypothetical protein
MLEKFITNVMQMREAQRNYFTAIAAAKKTKLPADFAKAANYLKQSKALEAKVDEEAPQVLLKLNTPVAQ